MSNPYFTFKQFTVYHDRCAMKVNTDGVLVGAWARLSDAQSILDIGTGSGLIDLMDAQRNRDALITGIEIDEEAARQAQENAGRSPWSKRIEIVCTDLRAYEAPRQFDAIISNPPYFANALKCPDNSRSMARHDETLSFDELVRHAARLLHPKGEFSLIIPANEAGNLLGLAIENRLYPSRKCWIKTTPRTAPKRCMLAFRFVPTERVEEESLVIEQSPSVYSEEYKKLTGDFYLKM